MNNSQQLTKVWDISSQSDLFNGETADEWTGSADVASITTSTTHKTGSKSLSFAKSGTTATTGIVSKTVKKNCSLFSLGKIKALFSVSALTNIASVSIRIGTDSSNYNVYTFADTMLAAGWNEIYLKCSNPASVTGAGVDWFNVGYIAFVVTFDSTANTLTAILLDSISLVKANNQEPNISYFTSKALNYSPGADQSVVVGVPNRLIYIYSMFYTLTVAGSASWQTEDDAAVTGIIAAGNTGGVAHGPSGNWGQPIAIVPVGKSLELDLVTGDLDGVMTYAYVES